VVEIADQSLTRDRTHKAKIYAEAGLPEYWIMNLRDARIEVYLNPDADTQVYESVQFYRNGETFTSPFAGDITVADLLPTQ
ncbi:MAG: Uma2 family endonuclease, partial [Bacteroidota bacterium]